MNARMICRDGLLLPAVLLLALAPALTPAWAQGDEAAALTDTAQAAYDHVPAQAGPLAARVESTGRYQAQTQATLMYEALAYQGRLQVAEVVKDHGRVSPGEVILRLEALDMEDQLQAARESLRLAEQRLAWSQEELDLLERDQVIAAERQELGLADARENWALWESIQRADTYRSSELGLQRLVSRVEDETEELKQLEALYEGARLASQTQDIVLERARRSLRISSEMLEMTHRANTINTQVTLPRQERNLANNLRWQETQAQHTQRRMGISHQRQQEQVVSARRTLRDARERLVELEADRQGLVVSSAQGGVITAITLRPGDRVQIRQAIATLQAQDRGTLSMTVSAQDLRVLEEGQAVQIQWQPFAEIQTTGTVRQIAWVGTAGGGATQYAVTIDVDEINAMIRPGMQAKVIAAREIAQAITVPTAAVETDDDGTFVMVPEGDGYGRVEVVVGPSDGERVQIIRGLDDGQLVRIAAESD